VDTLNEIVPPGPDDGLRPPPPPPSGRGRRIRRRLLGVAVVVLLTIGALAAVASRVEVPWIAIFPGSATNAESKVAISGATTYDDPGAILYLTVTQKRLDLLDWVRVSRDTTNALVRPDPAEDPAQTQLANRRLMTQSKSNAELVALTHLGYDVFASTGAIVRDVVPGAPADGMLADNDVIVGADGTPITTKESLTDKLRPMQPGTVVALDVENGDGSNRHTVSVTLGARPNGDAGGYLGVVLETRATEKTDVPVTVAIDSGQVGGNSAGLAFTLAIIDQMTPGSLTKGHKIAVTGTISLDESVGAVGGIPQKVVAARRAGAEAMIVPRVHVAEAEANAEGLKIIGVDNLKQALAALDAVPPAGQKIS
jgi:PDZ domain-containing protein